jgi:hypothetical protein
MEAASPDSHDVSPMADAAAERADSPQRRLWEAEIEQLGASAAGLSAAQRDAVVKVLASLVDDSTESVTTRAEARELLRHVRSTAPRHRWRLPAPTAPRAVFAPARLA